jgi:hypothetical protein
MSWAYALNKQDEAKREEAKKSKAAGECQVCHVKTDKLMSWGLRVVCSKCHGSFM